jgi:hypothetical protein
MEFEYEEDEEYVLTGLDSPRLYITKENAVMFDNVDSFVALSQENTIVKIVELYPFDSDTGNYELWDKVGQIVGNLVELEMLIIHFFPHADDDDDRDEARMPDWEILTRILPYLRRKVELSSSTEESDTEVEDIQGLARVIHGHPMISGFSSEILLTFANLVPWCSALATRPSLERVTLGLQEPETENQHDLVILKPLTELLRAPALRFVEFDSFYFTNAICHATANALEEGSSISDITFDHLCSFPDGGSAIIANALKRNVSVTTVEFRCRCDELFCNTLAAVLLCNSALQNLTVHVAPRANGRYLPSIFLALGMNTSLKSFTANIFDKFGDELCAAITSGLAKNTTLEELTLSCMIPSNDDGAVSARNALSFLCTNSTLKSLTVAFVAMSAREESCYVSAFRLEAVKMMQDNHFLESLSIATGSTMKVEGLLALVSALQRDTTLKTLSLENFYPYPFYITARELNLTGDEVDQLVSILMKNYGLERLIAPFIRFADDRRVKAILRLNGAGRRYLIKDGSSISKGLDVLSAVSDDINCVFLHLLENPGLCNRRPVDATTGSQEPGTNLDDVSSGGKRELAIQSQQGKEPRRRLA